MRSNNFKIIKVITIKRNNFTNTDEEKVNDVIINRSDSQ